MNLLHRIATAPYRTIQKLAADVADNMQLDKSKTSLVAEALVLAAENPSAPSHTDVREMDIMFDMFIRKRAITIQRHGDGYKIGGNNFAEVVCIDIREGLMEFLDANITLEYLKQ